MESERARTIVPCLFFFFFFSNSKEEMIGSWRENHLGEKLGESFVGKHEREEGGEAIRSKRMDQSGGGVGPSSHFAWLSSSFKTIRRIFLFPLPPHPRLTGRKMQLAEDISIWKNFSQPFFVVETANRGTAVGFFFVLFTENSSRKTIISKIGEEGNMVFFNFAK